MRRVREALQLALAKADTDTKVYVCLSILAGFIWFALESSFIFIIQGLLVSLKIMDANSSMLPQFYPKELIYNLILLICFGTLRASAAFFKSYISGHASNSFANTIRRQIVSLSFKNIENVNTSKVMDLFNSRAATAGFFIEQFCGVLVNGTILLLISIGCLYISTPLFLVGISVLVLVALPLRKFDGRISVLGEGHSACYSKINEIISNSLKNRFFLRIYHLVGRESDRVVSSINEYQKYNDKFILYNAIRTGVPLLAGSIAVGFIAYTGAFHLENSGIKLLSFIYLFIRFSQTFSDFLGSLSSMQVAQFNIYVIFDALRAFVSIPADTVVDQIKLNSAPSRIEGRNVSFSYENNQVFQDLNFDWKLGDVVLVKGESGVGKSTLISLVLGYLRPALGEIVVDGTPISSCKNDLSRWISYVGPEPYLVPGTLIDNMVYGSDTSGHISLSEALKSAKVDFLTDELIAGFQQLTESVPLSTGQKQRLSIARAFYRNPRILIFDEGTANLDLETEKHILDAIIKNKNQRITIFISHKTNLENISNVVLKLGKS